MTYHHLPFHFLLRKLLLPLVVHSHQALLVLVLLLQELLLQVVPLGSRRGHLLLVPVRHHHQPQVLLLPRVLLHRVGLRLRLRGSPLLRV